MLRNNHNREYRLTDSVSINIPSLESHGSGKYPKTEQTSYKVKFEKMVWKTNIVLLNMGQDQYGPKSIVKIFDQKTQNTCEIDSSSFQKS